MRLSGRKPLDIVRLAGRQNKGERSSLRIASGVELGGEPAARPAERLGLPSSFFMPTAQWCTRTTVLSIMWALPIGFGLLGLGLLVMSALWSTKALSSASRATTTLLQDPFQKAKKELEEMFDARNEDIVLDKLLTTIQLHIADNQPSNNFGIYATVSLVAGMGLAAVSLAIPLLLSMLR